VQAVCTAHPLSTPHNVPRATPWKRNPWDPPLSPGSYPRSSLGLVDPTSPPKVFVKGPRLPRWPFRFFELPTWGDTGTFPGPIFNGFCRFAAPLFFQEKDILYGPSLGRELPPMRAHLNLLLIVHLIVIPTCALRPTSLSPTRSESSRPCPSFLGARFAPPLVPLMGGGPDEPASAVAEEEIAPGEQGAEVDSAESSDVAALGTLVGALSTAERSDLGDPSSDAAAEDPGESGGVGCPRTNNTTTGGKAGATARAPKQFYSARKRFQQVVPEQGSKEAADSAAGPGVEEGGNGTSHHGPRGESGARVASGSSGKGGLSDGGGAAQGPGRARVAPGVGSEGVGDAGAEEESEGLAEGLAQLSFREARDSSEGERTA
jgi:hypothetical protein